MYRTLKQIPVVSTDEFCIKMAENLKINRKKAWPSLLRTLIKIALEQKKLQELWLRRGADIIQNDKTNYNKQRYCVLCRQSLYSSYLIDTSSPTRYYTDILKC